MVSETTGQFGKTVFKLDVLGNRTGMTLPTVAGSLATGYAYDVLGRLTAVHQGTVASGARIVGYVHDIAGRRTSASWGVPASPVATSSYAYTPAGRVSRIAHAWNGAALTLDYTYNKDGQRKGLTASDKGFLPSGLAASSRSYTSNALNQYGAVSGVSYGYDVRGNLTSDGVWTYGYDVENRLATAGKPGVSIAFGYDAVGRRLWKDVTAGGQTVSTLWLSVGDREVAEYEGVGTAVLKTRFVYGAGIDEPVAEIDGGGKRYVFADALGSVIGLANVQGQLTEKHAYTAFGLESVSGPGLAAFRFAGRRLDRETGLYHNRARAYSPTLGRFLQADPIGTADNINLYAYVGNDPLNRVDPRGEAGMIANTVLDFTPIVGDAKGFYEAYQDPTWTNIAAAGIGLVPGLGDAAAKGLKYSDELVAVAQKLYPGKAGKIEYHHIEPKYLGGSASGSTVGIDAAYHQMITNEFRNQAAYGTGPFSQEQRQRIMNDVYSKYPLPR